MVFFQFRSLQNLAPMTSNDEDLEFLNVPNNDKGNKKTTAWCPSPAISCDFAHPHCQPCGRKWLIIVSLGRSASTTLTHQMWQLPGIHMGGENNDFVGKLQNSFLQTLNEPQFKKGKASWVHEPFSKEMVACSVQSALEAINPPPRDMITNDDLVLGFKTVRLVGGNKNVTQTAKFLREAFPCARFLINYRSAEALKVSFDRIGFKKEEESVDEIQHLLDSLLQLGKSLPKSQTYFLDSGKWTKNVTMLNDMVTWLGYSEECHFQEVLRMNTKGKGYDHDKTELTMDPNCRYIG